MEKVSYKFLLDPKLKKSTKELTEEIENVLRGTFFKTKDGKFRLIKVTYSVHLADKSYIKHIENSMTNDDVRLILFTVANETEFGSIEDKMDAIISGDEICFRQSIQRRFEEEILKV